MFILAQAFTDPLSLITIALFITALMVGLFVGIGFILLLWYRNRRRESDSLNSTLLQVSVSRDNEVKIDAAEQLFSSLAALGSSSLFKVTPPLSFEVVGLPGDIRFYINTPNKYRDFVEKQINGAYPDAEIVPLTESSAKQKTEFIIGNEYNIFSQEGKVSFATLKLKSSNYLPIKVFKELAVDSMSSITSTLAKMGEGEGAAIQVLFQPAGSKWKKQGKSYISNTKNVKPILTQPNIARIQKKWKLLKIK